LSPDVGETCMVSTLGGLFLSAILSMVRPTGSGSKN
jgi:hypothetical protein